MLPVLISLSVLGLFAGAALVAMGRLRPSAAGGLDGLALGMLPALVLARLLPHAYESLGPGALWLAAVGFGLVTLSHHAGERAELRLGSALALPALVLHAVTDGATLAMSSTGRVGDSAGLLAVAAILHRIPEGFFVASRRRGLGLQAALLAALPLALATVAGALLGQRIFELLPDTTLDGVLAVGAGALLRLVSHSHDPATAPPPPAARAIGAAALLAGIAMVTLVPGADDVLQRAQPREFSMAGSLGALFIESAPGVLLGVALLAALKARAERQAGKETGRLVLPALQGLVHGVVRQLRPRELFSDVSRRAPGAPTALIVSLAVAATQLGLDTLALSLAWLGLRSSAVRALGSALLALFLGVVVSRLVAADGTGVRAVPAAPPTAPDAPTATGGFWARAQDVLDEIGAWLLLGLLLSAAVEAALPPNALQHLAPAWAYLLACALAWLGNVSALGATPVVAVLVHKGLALGAGLTYLWLAPLASLPVSAWLGCRPGTGRLVLGASAAALFSVAAGLCAGRLLPAQALPDLHTLVTHEHAAWEYASALLLAALLLRSLMRLGPRGFAGNLTPMQPHAASRHVHQHGAVEHVAADERLAAPAPRWDAGSPREQTSR